MTGDLSTRPSLGYWNRVSWRSRRQGGDACAGQET